MSIYIYEYVMATQPSVICALKKMGLLPEKYEVQERREELSFGEVVALMRHDRWKRVRGALRQVHPGRVIR